MWQPEQDRQFREHVFIFGIGMFLVSYLVSLLRYHSFEWAMLTSSVALGITVGAGLLLASAFRGNALSAGAPPEQAGQLPRRSRDSLKGNAVDFTVQMDDLDDLNGMDQAAA